MAVITEQHPPSGKFKDLYPCQRLIKEWVDHPNRGSYEVLPRLFTALHRGEHALTGRPPTLAEVVRNTSAIISGSPSDLLVPPEQVYLLASRYTDDLDRIIRTKPKPMETAIEDAAFSYYVFDRIHPFPDGNGRVGRMIVKAVLMAAGLRDPIFHDQRWYGAPRSDHNLALEHVDNTNNLAHLEVFLAEALTGSYSQFSRDFPKHRELTGIIEAKKVESGHDVNGRLLSDIWPGFVGLPLYGNRPH